MGSGIDYSTQVFAISKHINIATMCMCEKSEIQKRQESKTGRK